MKLTEIFTQLAVGEFSQLALGGNGSGEIPPESYPKLIPHVNLALTALHKRFPLKEGSLSVQLIVGRLSYPLKPDYAVSNRRSRETDRFILDTSTEPFIEDVLKIERVYNAAGKELGLNDESDSASVFTPTATTLKVPSAMVIGPSPDLVRVVYRANHKKLVMGLSGFDPDRVEVELPDSHLEAFLYYVASRVHNPIGLSNEFHAGNNYAAKYEQSCMELELKNLRVDQGSQNTRLERNGWV